VSDRKARRPNPFRVVLDAALAYLPIRSDHFAATTAAPSSLSCQRR